MSQNNTSTVIDFFKKLPENVLILLRILHMNSEKLFQTSTKSTSFQWKSAWIFQGKKYCVSVLSDWEEEISRWEIGGGEQRSEMKNQNIFLHTAEDGMQWVDMEQKNRCRRLFLGDIFWWSRSKIVGPICKQFLKYYIFRKQKYFRSNWLALECRFFEVDKNILR